MCVNVFDYGTAKQCGNYRGLGVQPPPDVFKFNPLAGLMYLFCGHI